jgi:Zn finger protein HypA/HybF involved in hydrogenase expression
MKSLHVEGLAEDVLVVALVEHRDSLDKLKKKLREKHLGVVDVEARDNVAREILNELGWVPKDTSKSTVEVTDPRQGELPIGAPGGSADAAVPKARATCECGRQFTAPAGQHLRACPDCGLVYRVTSDDRGELLSEVRLETPTIELLELITRERTPGTKPLSALEKKILAKWRKEHTERCEEPELVARGERVADPDVAGSGNEIEIQCMTYHGSDCTGFKTTDTPGQSTCPHCGQKYVVELVEGRALVRPFDLEKDG